jgi:hypothetical protein
MHFGEETKKQMRYNDHDGGILARTSIPVGNESLRCYGRIFNNVQGDSRSSVITVILVRPAGIEPATYWFEG